MEGDVNVAGVAIAHENTIGSQESLAAGGEIYDYNTITMFVQVDLEHLIEGSEYYFVDTAFLRNVRDGNVNIYRGIYTGINNDHYHVTDLYKYKNKTDLRKCKNQDLNVTVNCVLGDKKCEFIQDNNNPTEDDLFIDAYFAFEEFQSNYLKGGAGRTRRRRRRLLRRRVLRTRRQHV